MPLAPGTWLNHYQILGHLGSGGMGEVYRALDNKLQREVALKVLPKAFAQDPERLARFRREAQVLAQLNHVNIASIHNLEQSGETHFLVMELALGDTLRERIKGHSTSHGAGGSSRSSGSATGSPVPLEEALDICKQIAAGLECAHEKPIVHRDLKPANIKVTPEGVVKILDFGLARAFAGDSGSGDPADSPTLSAMTAPGTILGTAAYMSPEQARGKKVDKRTDIWALGCVLYELLTGQQAFQGEDIPEILAAVMKGEPDWSALPATTPHWVRVLLRRCLEKDAKRRLRDAADLQIQIEEVLSAPATAAPSVALPVPARPVWRRALPSVVTGLAAAVLAIVAVWTLQPAPPQPVSRTVIALPANEQLSGTNNPLLALSPDGTQLVYVSRSGTLQQLYLRAMDSLEARPIPGTDGAAGPFFSPDGQWMGFFDGQRLKKVSVTGGAVLTLCAVANPRGGSWGPNDIIAFASTNVEGLLQVSAAGGAPQKLTTLQEGDFNHRWPEFLPGGKTILFTATVNQLRTDDDQIAVQDVMTGEQRTLIRGGTYGRYVPTGHLVYFSAGTLMAVPFDLARMEVTGAPAPVLEGVLSAGSGAGHFDFSSQGSLVYVLGGTEEARLVTLVWVDRNGTEEPIPAPPRPYLRPRLSPDGRRLAIEVTGAKSDIWIYDLSRETLTPLTFEGDKIHAGWTPDGKRVLYSTRTHLYWKPSDGSGPEELLAESQGGFSAPSVTPDGKLVSFHTVTSATSRDIGALSLEGDPQQAGTEGRKARVLIQGPFNESAPAFSPDGRWLAYVSDETGRTETYVRSFPSLEGKWRISTEGGSGPLWNPNGRELFYRSGGKMMAVDVTADPTFSPGRPKALFEDEYDPDPAGGQRPNYDVSRDGQRFLMLKPVEQQTTALTQIHVVLNWFEELKRRVPAAR